MLSRDWCETFSGRVMDMFPTPPITTGRVRPAHLTAWARMQIVASLRACFSAEQHLVDGDTTDARASLANADVWLGRARDYLELANDAFATTACELLQEAVRANIVELDDPAGEDTAKGQFADPASVAISDYLERYVVRPR